MNNYRLSDHYEKLSKVTICTTMFNECDNVLGFFQIITGIREYFKFEFPLIIVNNGSTDSTQDRLEEMILGTTNTKILFNQGRGYGHGIMKALHSTKTEYALLITSDLQYSTNDAIRMIQGFIDLHGNHDPVCLLSNRVFRFDSRYQAFRGRLWRLALIRLLNLPSNFDPASQLKIVPVTLSLVVKREDFFWDIEQVLICLKKGVNVSVAPISFFPRKNGRSSLSGGFFNAEFNAVRKLVSLLRTKT